MSGNLIKKRSDLARTNMLDRRCELYSKKITNDQFEKAVALASMKSHMLGVHNALRDLLGVDVDACTNIRANIRELNNSIAKASAESEELLSSFYTEENRVSKE